MDEQQIKGIVRSVGGIVHSDGNIFFGSSVMFMAAVEAINVANAKPEPAEREWIAHAPGDEMPIPFDALCYLKFADGAVLDDVYAGDYAWYDRGNKFFNIIAYRLAGEGA